MSSDRPSVDLFWFRRDLRLHDNAGLFHALEAGRPVVPVFIFDRDILDRLEDDDDRRVEFIHAAIGEMQQALAAVGSTMDVRHGRPLEVFKSLTEAYSIKNVFTNHDCEPYARSRDAEVERYLAAMGTGFQSFKDHVLLERDEVMKDDGTPYTVFTPYSRKWQKVLSEKGIPSFASEKRMDAFHRQPARPIPSLAEMGFRPLGMPFPSKEVRDGLFERYGEERNFPALPATSRLGVHLRFGTISVRRLARQASKLSPVFVNELVWRDFYHMILWHFPQVGEGRAFKPAYDLIRWRNDEAEFDAWCRGMTGYPIVDAGMRELAATGFMHNRVRMITASFLSKHLLVDWRWGEAWFARKLLDFDLAANNGGWQWAAGSGCDAAPYFRIFNPRLQTEKFDKKSEYVRRWVPELGSSGYPPPIVDHEYARKRCLETYSAALKP